MRSTVLVSLLLCVGFGSARAQEPALRELIDVEPKHAPRMEIGESIACSLNLPLSAALFGIGQSRSAPPELLVSELFAPFRVWRIDENCQILSSWTTANSAGATLTGMGPVLDGSTYWQVHPAGSVITEYANGTGLPTGAAVTLPSTGAWGPVWRDDSSAPATFYLADVLTDRYLAVNAGGTVLQSWPHPDGGDVPVNGLSGAAQRSLCGGALLSITTGSASIGTVGQVGFGGQPYCPGTWDFSNVAVFVNGIAEFRSAGGDVRLAVVDNVTSTVLMLRDASRIDFCQRRDPEAGVLWVNGSRGESSDFEVGVRTGAQLAVGVQKIAASTGKFVLHVNAGAPSGSTIRLLHDLGNPCFPFVAGSPSIVANNAGRRARVGVSNYFGVATPDPAAAPTFPASLLQPVVDTANLAQGSRWTLQLIAENPGSSSSAGASLSNAVIVRIDP